MSLEMLMNRKLELEQARQQAVNNYQVTIGHIAENETMIAYYKGLPEDDAAIISECVDCESGTEVQ